MQRGSILNALDEVPDLTRLRQANLTVNMRKE